jgi:hypothetical protein
MHPARCRTQGETGAHSESGDKRAEDEPLTQRLAGLVGARARVWGPLTAGALAPTVQMRSSSSPLKGYSAADCWQPSSRVSQERYELACSVCSRP